ncbi:MAG: SycD/LcrH family type III secretion system chaperone [Chlamydiia bacterium]|nr:SycD/LcrH family type III secretion system chaperone [Chlamydiia bacterium]MCP5509847.1 SycD/LcrH family type III secretion system chaperone [Chlamydiales bacterium]HPE85288.1 SycD/LcrH family type III secretion system chaperone [Chlamydiales bacterium]
MEEYLQKTVDSIVKNKEPLMGGDFTDEDLSVLYSLAFGLYQNGDYEKASEIFQQLVFSKPFEPKHWQGLASVLQMQSNYQNALQAWTMAAMMLDTAEPHFHAAECLTSLGNKEQAHIALVEAEKRLTQSTADADLKAKIEVLKNV